MLTCEKWFKRHSETIYIGVVPDRFGNALFANDLYSIHRSDSFGFWSEFGEEGDD